MRRSGAPGGENAQTETPESGTEPPLRPPPPPRGAATKWRRRAAPSAIFPPLCLGPASSWLSNQSAAAVFSGRQIGAQLNREERWERTKGGRQNGGAACCPQRLSRSWSRTRPLGTRTNQRAPPLRNSQSAAALCRLFLLGQNQPFLRAKTPPFLGPKPLILGTPKAPIWGRKTFFFPYRPFWVEKPHFGVFFFGGGGKKPHFWVQKNPIFIPAPFGAKKPHF